MLFCLDAGHARRQRSVEWLGTGIIWLLIAASSQSGRPFISWSTQSSTLILAKARRSRFLSAGGYRKAIRVAAEDHSFFGTVLHTTLLTAPKGMPPW